ncbi:hypothetical protein [Brevundimonas sp.]|uniref:hypothetical protein n=1 Tax=Brevundimonas sp. TaxID=1871086 RepID=UPI002FDAA9DC
MNTAPDVIYDFDPGNLPPELLQAIGRMAMCAAQTESVMQSFIGAVLEIDNLETVALTAHMAAPLKDHVARALIELNGANVETIDLVDDLLDAISTAAEKRNVVIHNSILRHPQTGELFSYRQTARGSLQVSLQPVSVEEIEKDATLIYEAGMDLVRFMILNNITPNNRTRPVRRPVNRRKKAREERIQRRRSARAG